MNIFPKGFPIHQGSEQCHCAPYLSLFASAERQVAYRLGGTHCSFMFYFSWWSMQVPEFTDGSWVPSCTHRQDGQKLVLSMVLLGDGHILKSFSLVGGLQAIPAKGPCGTDSGCFLLFIAFLNFWWAVLPWQYPCHDELLQLRIENGANWHGMDHVRVWEHISLPSLKFDYFVICYSHRNLTNTGISTEKKSFCWNKLPATSVKIRNICPWRNPKFTGCFFSPSKMLCLFTLA